MAANLHRGRCVTALGRAPESCVLEGCHGGERRTDLDGPPSVLVYSTNATPAMPSICVERIERGRGVGRSIDDPQSQLMTFLTSQGHRIRARPGESLDLVVIMVRSSFWSTGNDRDVARSGSDGGNAEDPRSL